MNIDYLFTQQMMQWRHHFHRDTESGFEEINTSDFIASVSSDMGLEVHCGIGKTGLVASLSIGMGSGFIGLRADMDALNIHEQATNQNHASETPGEMHVCGYDGHMAMVLGAAKLLCERRDFNGTVRFVFQPAEEYGQGAKAMLSDGLLQRLPIDDIYGAHNMPGIPAGNFTTRWGGMGSEDNFVITIKGRGSHSARPHMGIDPNVIASEIVLAFQTIVSRNLAPSLLAVISCSELFTDGIRNAIPTTVIIKGDTRSYSHEVQSFLEKRMRELCEGICRMHGAECTFLSTPMNFGLPSIP